MSGPQPVPQPRTAARMFLLDPDDRVLLINDRVDLDRAESHWITPGGGIEAGETLREAAVREVYEETGISVSLPADAEPVYTDRELFSFAGRTYDQTNHHFLARLDSKAEAHPAAPTDYEALVAMGTRWWSLAELESSTETVIPRDIVEIVRKALVVE